MDQSLGSVILPLKISNLEIDHKFHVVSDEFNIPSHGIIGKDFLKRHKCLINYDDMTVTVRPTNAPSVKIEIKTEIIRGLSALPPRSETFKMFHINATKYPCIVENQQLVDNVFIPTTIITKKIVSLEF